MNTGKLLLLNYFYDQFWKFFLQIYMGVSKNIKQSNFYGVYPNYTYTRIYTKHKRSKVQKLT